MENWCLSYGFFIDFYSLNMFYSLFPVVLEPPQKTYKTHIKKKKTCSTVGVETFGDHVYEDGR